MDTSVTTTKKITVDELDNALWAKTTHTIGANYTATRASGTIANSIVSSIVETNTWVSGGASSDHRARTISSSLSGATAALQEVVFLVDSTHGGSATLAGQNGVYSSVSLTSTGNTTGLNTFTSAITLSSSGSVTNARNFLATAPVLSSTGTIGTIVGFLSGDLGNATKVTTAYGFAASDITASAGNVAGFSGAVSAGTGKYNLYITGTAQNYIAGVTGIGVAPSGQVNLNIGGAITGATQAFGIYQQGEIKSGVTAGASYYVTAASTEAAAFTIETLIHYHATQATFGAGSAVTVQEGFRVGATLTGGVSNFGFRGLIAAGSNRYNLYMDGTAQNYLAGVTGIGIAASSTSALALAASTTGVSSLRVPHGDAPSSPVNGDIWTTSSGLYVRINGATVGPLA